MFASMTGLKINPDRPVWSYQGEPYVFGVSVWGLTDVCFRLLKLYIVGGS